MSFALIAGLALSSNANSKPSTDLNNSKEISISSAKLQIDKVVIKKIDIHSNDNLSIDELIKSEVKKVSVACSCVCSVTSIERVGNTIYITIECLCEC